MKKRKLNLQKLNNMLDKKPIIFLPVLSITLNCFIEIMGRRSLSDFFIHIVNRPHLFLLNCFIIMCTYLIILLIRRRAFMVLLISVIWLACGITNCSMMFLRSLPFTARDIFLVYDGLRVAKAYFSIIDIILFFTAVIAVIGILILGYLKLPKCNRPLKFSRSIMTVSSFFLILLFITTVGTGDIALASDYDNINAAYEDCGFAFCFTSSIFDTGISEPESYSKEAIDEIGSKLDKLKTKSIKRPNIIFVQLESFFDPATINGLTYSKNPIPTFTRLREEWPSGYLCVPSLGAGTVNTEFEVLTGMNIDYFGVGEYPYDSTFRDSTCESLAYNLSNIGYTSHAIHNHEGTFYSRNVVYSNLGFDTFTSLEYMNKVEYNETGWAKDSVLTGSITDCLKYSDGTDFIFTVTVQGHGKYPKDYADSPISVERNEILEDADPEALEYYMYQLGETDAFIEDLITTLESWPEDVIVVFYGDHLPSLGMQPEQHKTGSLYNTEYVVWNNFGLTFDDKDIFAYELSAHVLNMLDIHEGTMFKFHQSSSSDPDYYTAMEMLEYDMLFGEKYIYGGSNPFAPTSLQLGIKEINFDRVFSDGVLTYASGSGFTPFSVIYVNGDRKDTKYINTGLLSTDYELEEGDVVAVYQTDSDKVILSSSRELTYQAPIEKPAA